MPNNQFNTILQSAQNEWMNLSDVIAIGQGLKNGQDCILVHVIRISDIIENQIPDTYKGIPVRLELTGGEVKAQK
jgi:hypothetical protein